MRALGNRLSKNSIGNVQRVTQQANTAPITQFSQWERLYEPATYVQDPSGDLLQFDDFNVDASAYFKVGTKLRAVLKNGSFRHFYIIAINGFFVTPVGEAGESFLPSSIDYFEYSDAAKPSGFPSSFPSNFTLLDDSLNTLSGGTSSTNWRLDGTLCTIEFHYTDYTLTAASDHLYTTSPLQFTTTTSVDQLYPIICKNNGKMQEGVLKLLSSPLLDSIDMEFTPLADTPSTGFDTWDAGTTNTSVSVAFSYFIES